VAHRGKRFDNGLDPLPELNAREVPVQQLQLFFLVHRGVAGLRALEQVRAEDGRQSGARDAVKRAGDLAKALGAKRVVPLPVSAPFHCALMAPAQQRLEPALRALATSTPRVPIVANVDAEPKRDARAAIDALVRQVSAPVLWEAVVARLAAEGVTTYVEVGPGSVLSGLVKKIHRGATVVNFGTPDDLENVERTLALPSASPGQPAKG